ncbi:MAG TPA: hypothetical protein PL131_12930 [Methylotenera sp.]|nr:hypothetical protein [Methylotenera sp.]HPH06768.1 hypothetical protein [Methylotenera sp.]HPM49863.1 hypothetical protein [Methylotenera sp.]
MSFDLCNYSHGQKTGYFAFGSEVIPYSFIERIKANLYPHVFETDGVLSLNDMFDYAFLESLNANEHHVLGICLTLLASEELSNKAWYEYCNNQVNC